MIFLAVGTQLPFDRLARALDGWCAQTGRGREVFGQIGKMGPESFRPTHFEWQAQIAPDQFNTKMQQADVIVSHAGMGTIITALNLGKPLVIMARRAHLNEHRNDHQHGTVKRFREREGVFAVENEKELSDTLVKLLADGVEMQEERISRFADESLTNALHELIHKH
ncbi:glycosyltransferase [uncultured Shimia sp.]|uniref:glycosyltransferase n=1 Tax=uncultured Shimia sp. TaxID=573152 RepID=UPI002624408F|nr:glycosyltransferase [uncultured Shimia sp.]